MKKVVLSLAIASVLIAVFGVVAWRQHWFGAFADGSDSAGAEAAGNLNSTQFAQLQSREIKALGRMTPAGGVLTIGALVGDQIAELHVNANDLVTKDKVLAELASLKIRELEEGEISAQIVEAERRVAAETKAANSRINLSKLNLKKARSSEAEIAAQEKQAALAVSNLELAKKDLQRVTGLTGALVSKQELERQQLLVKKAEAELAAAKATVESLKESRTFAIESAEAELDAANAARDQVVASISVASLKTKLEVAKKQTNQSKVIAPSGGTVLRVFTRKGEIIANKPILQMADLSQMVCIAEVYEGDIPRLKINQVAWIESDLFPGKQRKLEGRVVRIGDMIAGPELQSIDPFAPTDRHVVEVEIKLLDDLPGVARRVSFPVDVTIETSPKKSSNNTKKRSNENPAGMAKSRPQ